ncbi:hypothetical protein [Acinetobacter sp. ESBL14]|uniref:hypothetical protein n=1 Tax=Acinetobacter sp. ESBL14 TaxID=3077329 RepID=UPI002FC8CE6B
MSNYKIKVNDEAESKEAQELFFKLGYTWLSGCTTTSNMNSPYLYTSEDLGLWCGDYHSTFNECGKKELTLPQLRDLVAQSKAKSIEFLEPQDDGTYKLVNWTCMSCPPENFIEVPDEAELYVYWPHDKDYHFQSGQGFYEDGSWNLCSFSVEEIKNGDAGAEILWSREPIQEQGLISGREALERVAEGIVQYSCSEDPVKDRWITITDHFWDQYNLGVFLNKDTTWSFRLKPRTIKIELEIPVPLSDAEQMKGQVYYLNDGFPDGYGLMELDPNDTPFTIGAWRTEEEIKQVVAALRGIKG